MEKSNIITVGYWSTKGLGAVCRMVVLYSGHSLKTKNYKLQPVIKDNNLTYDETDINLSSEIIGVLENNHFTKKKFTSVKENSLKKYFSLFYFFCIW